MRMLYFALGIVARGMSIGLHFVLGLLLGLFLVGWYSWLGFFIVRLLLRQLTCRQIRNARGRECSTKYILCKRNEEKVRRGVSLAFNLPAGSYVLFII
jgi:hypothetical protein